MLSCPGSLIVAILSGLSSPDCLAKTLMANIVTPIKSFSVQDNTLIQLKCLAMQRAISAVHFVVECCQLPDKLFKTQKICPMDVEKILLASHCPLYIYIDW